MAELKNTIEDRLLDSEPMQGLYPEGPGKAEKLDLYINVKVNKIESGELYDVHECVVSVKRDKLHFIAFHNVLEGMRSLQAPCSCDYDNPNPHIMHVVFDRVDHHEDGGFDMFFNVVNSIER